MTFFEHYGKKSEDVLFFIFRFLVGGMFMFHGMQKFGWLSFAPLSIDKFVAFAHIPVWLALVVAITELVGGLLIMLGLLTRLAVIPATIEMIVVIITQHFTKALWPIANGGELAFMYLAAFLVLFVIGSGKWSLDHAIFKKEIF